MSELPRDPGTEAPVVVIENDADYSAAEALLIQLAAAESETEDWLIFIATQQAVAAYEAKRSRT